MVLADFSKAVVVGNLIGLVIIVSNEVGITNTFGLIVDLTLNTVNNDDGLATSVSLGNDGGSTDLCGIFRQND